MRHPNKFLHVRPEVEVKPLGVDFDGTNTVLGPWKFYNGADQVVSALITKDILKPSTLYHWRSRIVDIYGNKSLWAYANSNPETDIDFQTGPSGIGQTNVVM